jgi:hypothetical protein
MFHGAEGVVANRICGVYQMYWKIIIIQPNCQNLNSLLGILLVELQEI